MEQENLIQEIESYLNILLRKMNEEDYTDFIENTDKLSEFDAKMNDNKENELSEELLNDVLKIVEAKLKSMI